ncbi:MAG: hypothetical protein ACTHNM_18380 [Dyella sp.]|uniref:hypothetical protein n=1 Tax=Dyella sp. TaxID=1869338 RepID=UPI003F7DD00A
MKWSRRTAWIVFVIALLVIIGVGFYRAAIHEEPRPETAPASSNPVGPPAR